MPVKARLAAAAFWLALYAVVVILLVDDYQVDRARYIDQQLSRFETKMDAIVADFGSFAEFSIASLVETTPAVGLISAAGGASESEQNRLRTELYRHVVEQYRRMVRFGFRQVHFHLPDTTSFLRMHRPDTYGDRLGDVRSTVQTANEERRAVQGFEEGRIFNGFRFVFPLSDAGEHVGTVEASFSMAAVVQALSRIERARFVFAMRRSVVEAVVFEEELDNYAPVRFSDALLFDRSVYPDPDLIDLLSAYTTEISQSLDGGESFAFFTDRGELLRFHSVRNTDDRPVAYMISIAPDATNQDLSRQLYLVISFLTIATLIVQVLTWLVLRDREVLLRMAGTDQLTGIMNRHSFSEEIDRELERVRRHEAALSLMILDVDHFKAFNDTHGHNAGDQVLRDTAREIRGMIRSGDLFARWGGEEFIVAFPDVPIDGAGQAAEKIRQGVTRVSVSIGLAEARGDDSLERLVGRADDALYQAKSSGRNRTVRESIEDKKE